MDSIDPTMHKGFTGPSDDEMRRILRAALELVTFDDCEM